MLIKLLLLLAVAYFVWRAWHRIIRVPQPPRGGEQPRRGDAGRGAAALRIDDMVKCPACQTYVAGGASGCGRQDCPRRG
jgi:hypothetical protein